MKIDPATPRVFVAHEVVVDVGGGKTRWKFDIQRIIAVYGELVTALDSSAEMLEYEVALAKIERRLTVAHFDPKVDYFLAAGDMTAYGAMLVVSANRFCGTPRQLRHTRVPFDRYDVLPYVCLSPLIA